MIAAPPARPIPRARLAAAAALAAWMSFGPFYRQVLGGGHGVVLRHWRMFHRLATGFCEVRYRRRLPDGRELPLDRFALLDDGRGAAGAARLRLIRDEAQARAIGARLCRRLGRGADVRLYLRHATGDGWRPGPAGEESLCAARGAVAR